MKAKKNTTEQRIFESRAHSENGQAARRLEDFLLRTETLYIGYRDRVVVGVTKVTDPLQRDLVVLVVCYKKGYVA